MERVLGYYSWAWFDDKCFGLLCGDTRDLEVHLVHEVLGICDSLTQRLAEELARFGVAHLTALAGHVEHTGIGRDLHHILETPCHNHLRAALVRLKKLQWRARGCTCTAPRVRATCHNMIEIAGIHTGKERVWRTKRGGKLTLGHAQCAGTYV